MKILSNMNIEMHNLYMEKGRKSSLKKSNLNQVSKNYIELPDSKWQIFHKIST